MYGQEGKVAEMGRHAELVEKGGLYAEMWARQAEGAPDSQTASSLNLQDLEEAASGVTRAAVAPHYRAGPAGDPPLGPHGHGGHGFHG